MTPEQPDIPGHGKGWARNGIDHFVARRLDAEGLEPGDEAAPHALIRRVSLDLTGLPPTPEEVDRFVHDSSEDAYGDLVDRLLEKESFGEHWARFGWMWPGMQIQPAMPMILPGPSGRTAIT